MSELVQKSGNAFVPESELSRNNGLPPDKAPKLAIDLSSHDWQNLPLEFLLRHAPLSPGERITLAETFSKPLHRRPHILRRNRNSHFPSILESPLPEPALA